MAFLMSAVDMTAPSGIWQWFIIDVFGFIANYGWRVVVFVVLLKLILSPLDFYQRYKMRKNQRITEALKPQMEKLEKQFGEDKTVLQQKQMELNRKAGFSYMSACIPLIITLVLFITFYTALRSVSAFMEFKQYVEMYDSYVTAYEETGFEYEVRVNGIEYSLRDSVDGKEIDYAEMDKWLKGVFTDKETLSSCIGSEEIKAEFDKATLNKPEDVLWQYKTEFLDANKSYRDYVNTYKGKGEELTDKEKDFHLAMSILMQTKAQEATVEAFKENRTDFLWIKSLWVADVPWANSLPSWSSFKSTMSSTKKYHYLEWDSNPSNVYKDNQTMFNDLVKENTYNIVTAKVREEDGLYKTNGYLVMVILVVGLSLLSQFITTRQQKKSGQMTQANGMGMMKAMLFIMPIMLAVFALTSSSAFTLYMVTNSIMTLFINLVTSLIVNLIDGGFKKSDTVVIKHGRVDPNDINKK